MSACKWIHEERGWDIWLKMRVRVRRSGKLQEPSQAKKGFQQKHSPAEWPGPRRAPQTVYAIRK